MSLKHSRLISILTQCLDSPQRFHSTQQAKEYGIAVYAVKSGYLIRDKDGFYSVTELGKTKIKEEIPRKYYADKLLVILANANSEKGYITDETRDSSSVSNARNSGWITPKEGKGFVITPEGKQKLVELLSVYGVKASV